MKIDLTPVLKCKDHGGISSIFCKDLKNYVVGFNNGYIFMFWNGVARQFYGHDVGRPVLGLKVIELSNLSCEGKNRPASQDSLDDEEY